MGEKGSNERASTYSRRVRIVFLTTNAEKHLEVSALLKREAGADVERRTATLAIPPSVAPAEVAEYRALQAFKFFREPVFAEALAIELADGLVSGASYRQAFEQPGGSSWLKKHDGAKGIARIAVGYTADGKEARVFEAAIAGRLVANGRGKGVAPWERFWIPEGSEKTLAEGGAQVRNSPYVELAKLIAAK